MRKSLLLLFLCASFRCAADTSAATTEEYAPQVAISGELMAIAPKIAKIRQNIRPFDTISLSVTEEDFNSEGKWIPTVKKKIIWDRTANHLKIIALRVDQKSLPYDYNESFYANGTGLQIVFDVTPEEIGTFNPKRRISERGIIYKANSHAFDYANLFLAWFYYMNPPESAEFGGSNGILLYDALGKIGENGFNFIGRKSSSDELHFSVGHRLFQFDKNGLHKKFEWDFGDKKANNQEGSSGQEVTEFATKSGWTLPVTIVQKIDGKIARRQRIDPASLEINKKFTQTDFLVTIPKGTQVYDWLRDEVYVAGKNITTADIWSPDESLKSLFPKKEIAKATEKVIEKAVEAKPELKNGGAK